MKIKYYLYIAFLFVTVLSISEDVLAQQERSVHIEAVVNDGNGTPVANAEVFSNRAYAKTDAEGRFRISVEPNSTLIFEAKGFSTRTVTSSLAEESEELSLVPNGLYYRSDDKVQLAFRKANKGNLVGSVSTADPTEINSYDNNIWAEDIMTGRTLGLMGSNSIRGLGIGIDVSSITGTGSFSGNALYIVDGLPRDIDYIRASEIESITVLKDVNAAVLYGSAAVNGVVLITTKRGEVNKNTSRITASSGISTPHALPQYLNSADYMTHFNMARENDGSTPQYDDETIDNYRTGNPYRYPSTDYYSDEYIRSVKDYAYIESEFSGGTEDAAYYTNFGWNSYGSLLDFGEGADARNNIFNARGNVDLKITDWISTSIDGRALFVEDKAQLGNYWNQASSIRPNEYTPLIPFSLIDPDNELFQARKNDVNGEYLIGGNASYLNTPFGDSYSGGVVQGIERNFAFNNRIDADLASITEGLSFHTNISFDYYIRYNQSVLNDYSVYEPTWDDDEDIVIGLNQRGLDARPGTQSVGNRYFRRRFGAYAQVSYDRKFDDVHHITGSVLGYGSNYKPQGNFQGVKQAHLGLQATYAYDQRYMIDFSSAYSNSVKLAEGNRGGFSPTVGLGWMISSEEFMSSAGNVDMLKLRMTAGILNSDLPIGGFYYYDESYGSSGSYNWYEGGRNRNGRRSLRASNPNLGYAQRKEITLGMDGLFFNQILGLEANIFHTTYGDLITRPNTLYPAFYSDFIPYENYGSDQYQGAELGVSYNDTFGNFGLFVGVNALYVTSERIQVDEFWENDYQYRAGHPRDATFGLEALGLFDDQADIDNSPVQSFGEVMPGDIKYKDQNGDGIIDQNDEVYLRRWQHPLSGGIQVRLSYKNLSMYILGEGRSGAEEFREGNYYWVDGNDKYSEVVLNSWTPETSATATHPRLSSVSNSNNHRRSSYWLYDNSYFQIRRINVTYDMPQAVTNSLRMRDLSIFINASNVAQFAKNKDIRQLRVGSEPSYATISLGLKASI
ncbi:MAG: SusC/RagA family TonB-linked outer membrane protein [Balneolales bacterium]